MSKVLSGFRTSAVACLACGSVALLVVSLSPGSASAETAKVIVGKSCTGNHDCLSGQCDAAPGSGAKRACVPALRTGLDGEYCSKYDQCKNGSCVESACSISSVLEESRKFQDLSVEQRKKKIDELAALRAQLGAACTANQSCVSGYCDAGMGSGGTNKCVPAAGTGEDGRYCSQNAHCKSKLCAAHACSSLKELGESCPGGNSECQSHWCDAGMGSGGTNKCVPAAGTGKKNQYCSQNGHCSPGRACTAHKCQ